MPATTQVEVPYGYCTNFVIRGRTLTDRIARKLRSRGQSLVVSANGSSDVSVVRVHNHPFKPGDILNFAVGLGTLHNVEVHNMDDQYEEFIKLHRSKLPQVGTANVTIASGDGLFDVFNSLGATIVVPGGQTMNPSVRQLLQAVEFAPSNEIILLPNNKNTCSPPGKYSRLLRSMSTLSRARPSHRATRLALLQLRSGCRGECRRDGGGAADGHDRRGYARRPQTEMDGHKVQAWTVHRHKERQELISAGDEVIDVVLEAQQKSGAPEAESSPSTGARGGGGYTRRSPRASVNAMASRLSWSTAASRTTTTSYR
jgi:spore coat protein CotF